MITAAMLIVMVALMAVRVPVAISIGVAATLGVFLSDVPLELIPRTMTEAVDSFTLLAVPFFILAGNLMNVGGMTVRIFNFARRLLGHLHGGLAHVNIGGSMIFAGMSGAALADRAGLGSVEMKAMREHGYDIRFAAALSLASCTIGVIIPPSISFIVYSLVTGESTGRLFVAGVVPGVLTGLTLMAYVYVLARLRPAYFRRPEPFDPCALWEATRQSWLALIMPAIIMGFLLVGIATPTEVGVIAVLYALFLGLVIYRETTLEQLLRCVIESATTTAIIMYVIAASAVLSWVVTAEHVIHEAAAAIAAYIGSPLVALMLINVFLLGVGMVLEGLPALLITASILYPVVTSIGIDPIHFGVVICFNLILGIITPPMGIGLFVAARIANIPVEDVLRWSIPLLIPLLVNLMLVTVFPQLSLWLPDLVFGPGPDHDAPAPRGPSRLRRGRLPGAPHSRSLITDRCAAAAAP